MNECRVLKLVLQPLVENSIFHGIMMKKEERGVIRITGQRVDGDLLLFVEDDGVGMSEESWVRYWPTEARARATVTGTASATSTSACSSRSAPTTGCHSVRRPPAGPGHDRSPASLVENEGVSNEGGRG